MKYTEYMESLKTEMLSRLESSLAGLNKIKNIIKEVEETKPFYYGYNHYSESYLYSTFYGEYESSITNKFGRITGFNSGSYNGKCDLSKFLEKIESINLIQNFKRIINEDYMFLSRNYIFEIREYNVRYYGLTSLCSTLKYIFDNQEVLSDSTIENIDAVYSEREKQNTFIFSLTESKECLIRFFKNGKIVIKFESLEDLNQFVKALELEETEKNGK